MDLHDYHLCTRNQCFKKNKSNTLYHQTNLKICKNQVQYMKDSLIHSRKIIIQGHFVQKDGKCHIEIRFLILTLNRHKNSSSDSHQNDCPDSRFLASPSSNFRCSKSLSNTMKTKMHDKHTNYKNQWFSILNLNLYHIGILKHINRCHYGASRIAMIPSSWYPDWPFKN